MSKVITTKAGGAAALAALMYADSGDLSMRAAASTIDKWATRNHYPAVHHCPKCPNCNPKRARRAARNLKNKANGGWIVLTHPNRVNKEKP